jgi:hypothetical protein
MLPFAHATSCWRPPARNTRAQRRYIIGTLQVLPPPPVIERPGVKWVVLLAHAHHLLPQYFCEAQRRTSHGAILPAVRVALQSSPAAPSWPITTAPTPLKPLATASALRATLITCTRCLRYRTWHGKATSTSARECSSAAVQPSCSRAYPQLCMWHGVAGMGWRSMLVLDRGDLAHGSMRTLVCAIPLNRACLHACAIAAASWATRSTTSKMARAPATLLLRSLLWRRPLTRRLRSLLLYCP